MLLIGSHVFAQNLSVHGQLVDSVNSSPLPNAVVSLKGSAYKKIMITDMD